MLPVTLMPSLMACGTPLALYRLVLLLGGTVPLPLAMLAYKLGMSSPYLTAYWRVVLGWNMLVMRV